MRRETTNATRTWLMAIAALLIGFVIGYSVNKLPHAGDAISGSIGKLDRYRNVQVSEADIQLRNELIEDSLRRSQYQQFLTYYYYQALRTATDAQQVHDRTSRVEDFNKLYYPYADALEHFSQYLDAARMDILEALSVMASLNENESLPVIDYLNRAQNAIARIRHHDAILMNYMKSLASFIEENQHKKYPLLEEAHDILLFNLASGAILSQNKPTFNYLDKQAFLSSGDGRKAIWSEMSLNAIDQQFIQDFESMDLIVLLNSEAVAAFMLNNIEQLNRFLGEEHIGQILFSTEKIGFQMLSEQMIALQQLGDFETLGAINSMEMYKAY